MLVNTIPDTNSRANTPHLVRPAALQHPIVITMYVRWRARGVQRWYKITTDVTLALLL